jgi:hypothetical protein
MESLQLQACNDILDGPHPVTVHTTDGLVFTIDRAPSAIEVILGHLLVHHSDKILGLELAKIKEVKVSMPV